MNKTEHDLWLAERRKGIGGSDAGAVLGLSPWQTPLDVYLDKTGRAEPIEDNEPMFWGRTLETAVANVYAQRTGDKVRRMGMRSCKENPFMLANIDRQIVGDPRGPGVLEVKTAGQFSADEWGESGTDEIPSHYYAQLCHYLAVTGYAWARLAVLIGGRDFRIYDVPRDEDLIKSLTEIESKFWRDNVLMDCPPDASTSADINKLWPKDTGREVVASPGTMASVFELRGVKQQLTSLNKRKTDLEDDIKTALADATTLIDEEGNRLATWKTQPARRLNSKKIKFMLGDDLPEYQTESTTRVLRVK